MSTNQIKIEVSLDDNKLPESISWSAPGQEKENDAKAILLSLFERDSRDTLRIDLWTKDMQIQEMDRFFYQTLRSLADSYLRSTGNTALSESMQKFAQHFGEEVGMIPRQ